MRRYMIPLLLLVLMASVAQAENIGSAFGALMTAQSINQGQAAIGGRLGIADATSFYGTVGYGFAKNADGRVKIGMVGDDLSEGELTLGADTKWQIWRSYSADAKGNATRTKHPFDMALGPFVEWFQSEERMGAASATMSATQLGLQLVGSYPVALKAGSTLSPYARLNARNEWLSAEVNDGLGNTISGDESDIAFGFNGGLAWRPRASAVSLFGEFQVDGNNGVFFGIDYLLAR